MKQVFLVFLVVFLIMLGLSLIPSIKLFEFHFYLKNDLQELDFNSNMSLSYFFGYGYDMSALKQYQVIELTWKGWVMSFLLILGTPLIVAYRYALYKDQIKNK